MSSALLMVKTYPDPVDAGLRLPEPAGEARAGELPVLTPRGQVLLRIENDARTKRNGW
jgi:hypothetical protein